MASAVELTTLLVVSCCLSIITPSSAHFARRHIQEQYGNGQRYLVLQTTDTENQLPLVTESNNNPPIQMIPQTVDDSWISRKIEDILRKRHLKEQNHNEQASGLQTADDNHWNKRPLAAYHEDKNLDRTPLTFIKILMPINLHLKLNKGEPVHRDPTSWIHLLNKIFGFLKPDGALSDLLRNIVDRAIESRRKKKEIMMEAEMPHHRQRMLQENGRRRRLPYVGLIKQTLPEPVEPVFRRGRVKRYKFARRAADSELGEPSADSEFKSVGTQTTDTDFFLDASRKRLMRLIRNFPFGILRKVVRRVIRKLRASWRKEDRERGKINGGPFRGRGRGGGPGGGPDRDPGDAPAAR